MTQALTCHLKPYLQPFERTLALRELEALSHASARHVESGDRPVFKIDTRTELSELTRRLAYWERVGNGTFNLTKQSLYEASASVARSNVSVDRLLDVTASWSEPQLPNRRALRYGVHGIHEYRGRFFPQLVRALLNVAGVPRGGLVADPMVGSGTTAVEAMAIGCNAIGLDLNPLSVFISRTKVSLLRTSSRTLVRALDETTTDVRRTSRSRSVRMAHFESLPEVDRTYLVRWFSTPVLRDLDSVMRVVLEKRTGPIRDLLLVSVSNILREVSWQKIDDLRVRKEVKHESPDVFGCFLDELEQNVRMIAAYRAQLDQREVGLAKVAEGDARTLDSFWRHHQRRVDVVITSPPYATALPYLDTDRLSLVYLGLLSRPEHRQKDRLMIGNREISQGERSRLLDTYDAQAETLVPEVRELVDHVRELNDRTPAGFRRRNVASLLSKYFADMRHVFVGISRMLRPGHSAFVVVGSNHTVAGGQRVEIDTARLLTAVAEGAGLKCVGELPMEMLVSRDIFRRNAGPQETVLELRA